MLRPFVYQRMSMMSMSPTIGILALQGAFDLHVQVLQRLNVPWLLVKTQEELARCDALIIPGGESTTMRWFFKTEGLTEAIKDFIQTRPVMGTCAGLILLAKNVADDLVPQGFGAIDVDVRRNAFGRQVHSHTLAGTIDLGDGPRPFPMVFIRAPRIERVGSGVDVLGLRDDEPTMVKSGHILAMSFHPELSGRDDIHEYFVQHIVSGTMHDQSTNPLQRKSA